MSNEISRSLRSKEVVIGTHKYKIIPWSGRDNIRFTTTREDFIEEWKDKYSNKPTQKALQERNDKIFDMICENLLYPNIVDFKDNKEMIPLFDKRILFIEMYKISRGNIVSFRKICVNKDEDGKECRFENDIDLDINKDVKWYIIDTSKEIVVNDIYKFKLRQNHVGFPDKEGQDLYEYEMVDMIDRIYEKGKELDLITNEDKVKFVFDELSEKDFNKLVLELMKVRSKIDISKEYTCLKCGDKQTLRFVDLPDFSIF